MNSKERHERRYQRRKAKRIEKLQSRAEAYSQWDNVFGFEPLMECYKNTAKASKKRTATQIWMSNLAVNAKKEADKLRDGKWKSRGFNCFRIKERGKWREIKSVHISEKGIQNSICNNCLVPIIRPHLIYDNGASLQGKGTDFSLDRFVEHLLHHIRQYGREGGICFFDFSGYFSSIPIAPLTEKAYRLRIRERIMEVFRLFVDAFGEIGLGLGSQVSQICAVFYPNEIDHWIKDRCGINGYARHMDDGYIIHHDIQELKRIVRIFEQKCESIGIKMNRKKCQIVKLTKQFRFLKVRFFITETGKIVKRIGRHTLKRERNRLKAFRRFYDAGLMTQREIYLNLHSWLLSINRGKTFHVKQNMIRYYNSLFPEFSPYRPLKVKTRRQKVLDYIARKEIFAYG